jgi:hypothetical protein
MSARAPRFIDIDGKRFLWRDIIKRRQEQREAARRGEQPVLFELHEDCRPATHRTAAGRYLEPSLFTLTDTREFTPSNPKPNRSRP